MLYPNLLAALHNGSDFGGVLHQPSKNPSECEIVMLTYFAAGNGVPWMGINIIQSE
jgi:hypothetical protein